MIKHQQSLEGESHEREVEWMSSISVIFFASSKLRAITFCLLIDKSVGRKRLRHDAWLFNLFRSPIDSAKHTEAVAAYQIQRSFLLRAYSKCRFICQFFVARNSGA